MVGDNPVLKDYTRDLRNKMGRYYGGGIQLKQRTRLIALGRGKLVMGKGTSIPAACGWTAERPWTHQISVPGGKHRSHVRRHGGKYHLVLGVGRLGAAAFIGGSLA